MWGFLFAGVAIGLWVGGIARDFPVGNRWKVALGLLPLALAGIVGAFARAGLGRAHFAAGIGAMFVGFVIVTRGHTLRAVKAGLLSVPEDVQARYQQHVARHQLLGLAVGLALAAATFLI